MVSGFGFQNRNPRKGIFYFRRKKGKPVICIRVSTAGLAFFKDTILHNLRATGK